MKIYSLTIWNYGTTAIKKKTDISDNKMLFDLSYIIISHTFHTFLTQS